MSEEGTTTIVESQAAPSLGDAPADAAELNVGLLLVFVGIIVLIAIQNLWLRRRAERNARSEDEIS